VRQGVFDLSKLETGAFNRQAMASAHITQHILTVWPSIVIVVSGHAYHKQDVLNLRRAGIRTAVLLTEAPYFGPLEKVLRDLYDVAFTNERLSASALNAHYLPHAYNADVHTKGASDPAKVCDAFFVGSWFEERRKLLMPLAESGIGLVWKGHDLSATAADILPNAEAAQWYRSAKVSLNIHRTTTSAGSGSHIKAFEAESLNPRAYEVPACGGFLLSDDSRAELRDIFGDYAPTYKAGDADDLARQTVYWLRHDARREETAASMHDAVQPHSWQARARQVLEAIV